MGALQERQRFEWVIVDSPPLASVTDAQLLSRQVDASLFVVRYDSVSKALVRRMVQALQRSGQNVLGVVLNAVETKARGYQYYYHSLEAQAEPKPATRWFGLARR